MKTVILFLCVWAISTMLHGQAPDHSLQCRKAMKEIAFMAGEWEGTATVRTGPGPAKTMKQKGKIQWELDSLVLTIEGVGSSLDSASLGKKVFHSFGVLNFDPYKKQYELKTFQKEGTSANAYFKVLQPNKFEWGFDIPTGAKLRYTIHLDPVKKTWHETGEYIQGDHIFKYIELTLKKL